MSTEMKGTQFKFKLLESASTKTVSDVRNNFVIFDDGSRVEQTKLHDIFEQVGENITESNKSNVPTNIGVSPDTKITESTPSVQNFAEAEVINPDTFFDSSNITNRITSDASKIDTNSMQHEGSSYSGSTVLEKPIGQNVRTDEPIRQVDAVRNDFSDDDKRLAGYDVPAQSTVSCSSFIQQLKRTNKVKLKIEVEEKIPKADFIRMMDENFDGGVLNYLVTDVVNKLIKNPSLLEKHVRAALEDIVYKKIKKPRKTATTPRKTSTKSNVKEKSQTNDK